MPDDIYTTVDLIPDIYYWECPICWEARYENTDTDNSIVTCEKCNTSFFAQTELEKYIKIKGE